MHIAETFDREDVIPTTKIVVLEGEGSGGKGTSGSAIEEALDERGRSKKLIDQGQKFRVMTRAALAQSHAELLLADQESLGEFLQARETHETTLKLLAEVAAMSAEAKKAFLRSDDVQANVKAIGLNPNSHTFAVSLMKDEVRQAAAEGIDTVIIDGRTMMPYAEELAEQKVAQYVLGFFFQCDAAIAGRRNMGHITDPNELDEAGQLELLRHITMVSDRNRSDTLRDTDPVRPPHAPHMLGLHDFQADDETFVYDQTLSALRQGSVMLNTTYTRSIEEMTRPVVALVTTALDLQDYETERFQADPLLWNMYQAYNDPEETWHISDTNNPPLILSPSDYGIV